MKHLLVVEDETAIAEALQEVLEAEGFGVTVVRDPTEALAQFQAVKPDLVLMDLMLPVRDGRRLFQSLREAPGRVPVVLMSAGFFTGEDRAHAAATLQKPFTLAALLRTLERLLGPPGGG